MKLFDFRSICLIFGLSLCGALMVTSKTLDIIEDDKDIQGK